LHSFQPEKYTFVGVLSVSISSGLLLLDNPEHPDPGLRLARLPGERRASGISPGDGGSLRTVYVDNAAGQPLLVVRTIGHHWAG